MKPQILAVTVCAALALSACGGDDKSKALTKDELGTKASAICKTADTAANKLDEPSVSDFQQKPEVAASYLDKLSPIAHKQNDALHALTPAADVKADWNALLDKSQAVTDLFDKVLAKAKAKDPSGFTDLQNATPLTTAFSDAAKKVGASDCTT
jgi:hypothetical protein